MAVAATLPVLATQERLPQVLGGQQPGSKIAQTVEEGATSSTR